MDSASAVDGDEAHLIPGASIADGRYRLLVFHGGPPAPAVLAGAGHRAGPAGGADLRRPRRTLPDDELQESCPAHSGSAGSTSRASPGCSTSPHTGAGAWWSSEWIRGGSLQEVADTSPSPSAGSGPCSRWPPPPMPPTAPGSRCPSTTPAGCGSASKAMSRWHFPATMPDCHPPGRHPRDRCCAVRPAGQSLAAARVGRAQRSGTRRAPTRPVSPSNPRDRPRHSLPDLARPRLARFKRMAVSARLNTFELAAAGHRGGRPHRPDRARSRPAGPVPAQPAAGADAEAHARRRRNLLIGVGVGAGVLVIALMVLASVLSQIFGDVGGGLKGDQLGLNPSTSETSENQNSAAQRQHRQTR